MAAGHPAGAPVPWTISEVLNVGFNAVKAHPGELIGGFFLAAIIPQLPGQIPVLLDAMGVISSSSVAYWVIHALGLLTMFFVGSFLWVGQIRIALAAARQQPVDLGLLFSGGDRVIPMAILSIVLYVCVLLGTILLVVPGIIVALGCALAAPLIVEANLGPLEALRESWEAMNGHKLSLFLFGLVGILISLAGVCACYVGFLVVYPALVVAYAEIFRRVTGRMG